MARPKKERSFKTMFSKRLNILLTGKKIREFEQKYGLSNGQISRFLDGVEPKMSSLEAIIKGTGCNAAWLLFGEGEPFSGKSHLTEASGVQKNADEKEREMDEEQRRRGLDMINTPASIPGGVFPFDLKKSAPRKALDERLKKEILSLCLNTQSAIGEFAQGLLESNHLDPHMTQGLAESLQSLLRSVESAG